MKNRVYKSLITLFYLLSFLILVFCIKVRFSDTLNMYTSVRLVLLMIVCIFIYINSFIMIKKLNISKKVAHINLTIIFIVYITTILMLTLFDSRFGRQGLIFAKWDSNLLKSYMDTSFNMVPFKTINLFINGYLKGIVSFKNFSINIFGNFVAFMPCGILVPALFKKINKYYKFLIIMIMFVSVIELLQFLTLSGSCDIDDLILNIIGSSIIYFIYKIKFINRIVNKILFIE